MAMKYKYWVLLLTGIVMMLCPTDPMPSVALWTVWYLAVGVAQYLANEEEKVAAKGAARFFCALLWPLILVMSLILLAFVAIDWLFFTKKT